MRRALILSLFLVACQNHETNGRLARVEKKPDDIQPAPAPAVPVVPKRIGFTTEGARHVAQTISDAAADRLEQEHRAYWIFHLFGTVDGLVVEHAPGQTYLYRRPVSQSGYRLVRHVPDFIRGGEMDETFEEVSAYAKEIQR